jgi:DNA polymerase elongation subunit (family B)
MLEMMSRSVPLDDLAKITQAGREAKEYALTSQPIRRFLEREERMGRPVKVGERFRWWLVRPPIEFTKNKEKVLRGDWMRRALEEEEKIDTFYYIDSLKSPIKTLFKATFGDDSFFDKSISLIKLKKANTDEVEERPWPIKRNWKQKPKNIRRVK